MAYRSIISLALAASATAAAAQDVQQVPFTLDWTFEGPSAPYFAAVENGHFADEGLEVEISAGTGSLDAIPKVATGAFPVGFADINSLIKFLDQNPDAPVKAVMMIYDKPAFAIVGRVSQGVEEPGDLEGKILGAPPPDGAWAQFPIFAAANDLDTESITIEPVGFPTREPMLAEGNVDAITGFSFTSFLNLARLGVPEEDISVMLMADHGVDLYGNVIIANTDWAAENEDALRGFLSAVAEGWQVAIDDPAAATELLLEANPAADAELEQRRLELSIEQNVRTDWVQENGFGIIDPERLDSALQQIATTYEFQGEPSADVFTDQYLPEGGFTLD